MPHGLWPAQAVANYALAGAAAIDITTASTAYPVYDFTDWDADLAAELGARVEQFPRVLPIGAEAGRLSEGGAALASGCIDAFAEELVAGADQPGDVLVLLGTTLIVWVVAAGTGDVPGWVVLPNPAAGQTRVGGPSNAGGLFCDWVGRMVGPLPSGAASPRPDRVPVWAPYPRGERSPINNPDLRAVLDGLDLTHDGGGRAARRVRSVGVRRAARDRRDARRARLRAAADRGIGWRDPRRRLAPGAGRCHGIAGRLRRGSRRRRARVRVARAYGCGARRADCDARGAAVGTCGSHGGTESQTGWSRWPSATSGSAGCRTRSRNRRQHDELTRVDEVHVARANRRAVGIAHDAPVRSRSRRCRDWRARVPSRVRVPPPRDPTGCRRSPRRRCLDRPVGQSAAPGHPSGWELRLVRAAARRPRAVNRGSLPSRTSTITDGGGASGRATDGPCSEWCGERADHDRRGERTIDGTANRVAELPTRMRAPRSGCAPRSRRRTRV